MVKTNVGLFLVAEKSSILVMVIHKNGTMNLVSNFGSNVTIKRTLYKISKDHNLLDLNRKKMELQILNNR